MLAQDRRTSRRLIMKVPLRFRPMKATSIPEETAASMNISTHGVFFATEQKVSKGLLLQVHLKMPREIIGDRSEERRVGKECRSRWWRYHEKNNSTRRNK